MTRPALTVPFLRDGKPTHVDFELVLAWCRSTVGHVGQVERLALLLERPPVPP